MALSKIQAESINLADTFAFTGTVTGAGKLGQVLTQTPTSSQISATSSYVDSGLSINITPASANLRKKLSTLFSRSLVF